MTAGRPIGERIRALCEILESNGPQGIAELREQMPNVERSNIWKYCGRGVSLGLITVDGGNRHKIFAVVPGWVGIVEARSTEKKPTTEPKPRPEKYKGPILTRWVGVSNVFQMGGNNGP